MQDRSSSTPSPRRSATSTTWWRRRFASGSLRRSTETCPGNNSRRCFAGSRRTRPRSGTGRRPARRSGAVWFLRRARRPNAGPTTMARSPSRSTHRRHSRASSSRGGQGAHDRRTRRSRSVEARPCRRVAVAFDSALSAAFAGAPSRKARALARPRPTSCGHGDRPRFEDPSSSFEPSSPAAHSGASPPVPTIRPNKDAADDVHVVDQARRGRSVSRAVLPYQRSAPCGSPRVEAPHHHSLLRGARPRD